MNLFGLTDTSFQKLMQALETFPEIEKAIMFGSRAMGTEKKGSDVDLAIQGQSVTSETVTKLHTLLEENLPLPYFFDIVDYATIQTPELKRHIDEFGKTFYPKRD